MEILFTTKETLYPYTTPEEAYNSVLLGTKINNISRKIIEINIDLLDEIDDQPFRINQNKVEQYAESIKGVVVEPIPVRAKDNGRYEILAG
ncbi:MAG: ParB N-terminal domain-containing protein [Eubacteriales bacterium]